VIAGGGDDFVLLLHACELDAGKVLSGGESYDTLIVPVGACARTKGAADEGDEDDVARSVLDSRGAGRGGVQHSHVE
jgi:hypothetical protein